jgi:O-antigen ligase/polysaccharide polymerase Wzy-like membrane protein
MAFASACAAFSAGMLTAFTVSIGGELPLGEVVLTAIFCWVAFCALVNGSLPPEIPRTRLFRVLLVCQVVAFLAYVLSDLYRHSTVHDMGRGWARMVFLAVDIVAVAYLFGISRLNLLIFLAGELLGDSLHSVALGALYGDMWKFGVGVPLTYLVLFLASFAGRPALAAAAFGMSAVHFVMDYRSFGGICLVAGTATLVTLFPRRARAWLAIPAVLAVAAAIGAYAYKHAGDHRATRSNVSRSAMLIAAYQGFASSPIIGQGSWFSKSTVFDNFMQIRADAAKAAHVGGFPEANEDPGTVAFHSQILVALAEGGIFGAAFFLAFGGALVAAIYRLTFRLEGGRFTGIYLLILVSALFNWFLSPFSGAHRVYIAVACGLLLFLPASPGRRAGADPIPR